MYLHGGTVRAQRMDLHGGIVRAQRMYLHGGTVRTQRMDLQNDTLQLHRYDEINNAYHKYNIKNKYCKMIYSDMILSQLCLEIDRSVSVHRRHNTADRF